MRTFKADLHIHTILSPCAGLEMSPKNIVRKALENQLDIIGITDHNSTRQCEIVFKEALKSGITVYTGVEITTKEEIHCLAFFSNPFDLSNFQLILDDNLPVIKNDPLLFGYQVVVDENENIIFEEEKLLINALALGIEKIESIVHQLNGLFIPAHIDKSKNSIISQLGFIPESIKADAFEVTKHVSNIDRILEVNQLPASTIILKNSDAHLPEEIGRCTSNLEMESTDFSEFCLALKNQLGRKVVLQ
ncbi:MAG TPA: PHP domain-containing protein [Lentimicrobium sp.]|nr:PHP domain-containing protein [Lentimicrobium sp.]